MGAEQEIDAIRTGELVNVTEYRSPALSLGQSGLSGGLLPYCGVTLLPQSASNDRRRRGLVARVRDAAALSPATAMRKSIRSICRRQY